MVCFSLAYRLVAFSHANRVVLGLTHHRSKLLETLSILRYYIACFGIVFPWFLRRNYVLGPSCHFLGGSRRVRDVLLILSLLGRLHGWLHTLLNFWLRWDVQRLRREGLRYPVLAAHWAYNRVLCGSDQLFLLLPFGFLSRRNGGVSILWVVLI